MAFQGSCSHIFYFYSLLFKGNLNKTKKSTTARNVLSPVMQRAVGVGAGPGVLTEHLAYHIPVGIRPSTEKQKRTIWAEPRGSSGQVRGLDCAASTSDQQPASLWLQRFVLWLCQPVKVNLCTNTVNHLVFRTSSRSKSLLFNSKRPAGLRREYFCKIYIFCSFLNYFCSCKISWM